MRLCCWPIAKDQDPKSQIPNPESEIQILNPKSPIQNSQHKIPNPKSRIRNPTCGIPNPKCTFLIKNQKNDDWLTYQEIIIVVHYYEYAFLLKQVHASHANLAHNVLCIIHSSIHIERIIDAAFHIIKFVYLLILQKNLSEVKAYN